MGRITKKIREDQRNMYQRELMTEINRAQKLDGFGEDKLETRTDNSQKNPKLLK